VPARIERQRAQLQDAMVDTHFMIGFLRVAIAADPDLLNAWSHFIQEMGGEVVAAVAASHGPAVEKLPVATVKIGDLEDLENLAKKSQAELLIGNSHAAQTAERLTLPLLRCGFPLYDVVGGYQKCFIGYAGSRQILFDLANLVLNHAHHHEIPVYRSVFSQKPLAENARHPLAAGGLSVLGSTMTCEVHADDAHPTHAYR